MDKIKSTVCTKFLQGLEQSTLTDIADGNVKQCNHFGKGFGNILKLKDIPSL